MSYDFHATYTCRLITRKITYRHSNVWRNFFRGTSVHNSTLIFTWNFSATRPHTSTELCSAESWVVASRNAARNSVWFSVGICRLGHGLWAGLQLFWELFRAFWRVLRSRVHNNFTTSIFAAKSGLICAAPYGVQYRSGSVKILPGTGMPLPQPQPHAVRQAFYI